MSDLQQVLAEHQRWLTTEGQQGSRADLSGWDLRGADLKGCELTEACLRGARLSKANLDGAHLEHTVLRDANLSDANLAGSTGLLGGQLAGTNVTGARLPDAISKFDAFGVVVDGAKSFTTMVLSMLAAVAYAILTIGSTKDANLLANSGQTQLPVLGTQTPIVEFFWLGPLLLLGLYLYYLINAQRLWELLAEMPAVFPDGRSLDKRLNALLLSAIVHANLAQLRSHRPPLSWLQEKLSIFVSWWVVPLTLLVFWARYLRRHDWAGTAFHIVVIVMAAALGLAFYRLAIATLRGDEQHMQLWHHPLRHPSTYLRLLLPLALGLGLALVAYGAIEGVPGDAHGQEVHALSPADPRRWLPHLYAWLDLDPTAELQGAELSQKPTPWSDGPGEVHHVKGAHLHQSQLRHARAAGGFFVNADLREAQLEGAVLTGADLRQADLRGADLSYCEAGRARLDEADLANATLVDANLGRAQLTGADLKGARLQWADLQAAQLSGARLALADLREANMLFADLRGANLEGANLEGAHLEGADLRHASGLQQAQLDLAHTNEQTQVSPPWTVKSAPAVESAPRWRHP